MTDTQEFKLPKLGPGPEYTEARIWLPQMWLEAVERGESVIENRVFHRCIIEGPAVLLPLKGCDFDGCNMGNAMGDIRNLLLQPLGPEKVTGAIPFNNCRFVNCTFARIGFTGAPAFLEQVRQVLEAPAA